MIAGVVALFFGAHLADARIIRIDVQHRESFGAGRQYQILTGVAIGELDPRDPLNAIINDLGRAPRNARGDVEYSATFTLELPADPQKLSGVLLYEVPNRGNSPLQYRTFTDDLEAGHALLSSGWQGDLTPQQNLETITAPVARNADGSSITGLVLARLSDLPAGANTASLTAGYAGLRYQRPATLDTNRALLTKQASDDGQIIPVPATDWAFADCTKTPFPGEPDAAKLCLRGGFDSALLYQVVYTAKDPLVLGIGLAATRDIVSFFRYSEKDDRGAPIRSAGTSGTPSLRALRSRAISSRRFSISASIRTRRNGLFGTERTRTSRDGRLR